MNGNRWRLACKPGEESLIRQMRDIETSDREDDTLQNIVTPIYWSNRRNPVRDPVTTERIIEPLCQLIAESTAILTEKRILNSSHSRGSE